MKRNSHIDSRPRLAPAMPYILFVGGLVGLICSAILSYDSLQLAKNPTFTPVCNLNPVVSCGSVLHSTEGSVLGFPNSWLGIVGFTVLMTVGAALIAGASYRRWFWLSLAAGIDAATVFAYWMLWQSVYRIHALCPFCLTVDLTITVIFWYYLIYIVRERHLPLPRRLIGVADFVRRHHFGLLMAWLCIIAGIILHHFWYYYGKYI